MKFIDLKQYGYIENEQSTDDLIPARVIEQQREQYTVITKYGELSAAIKGSFHHSTQGREDFPCVGDFVLLQYNDTGVSLISSVLPRRSKFSRADFSGHSDKYAKTVREQVVATNFDYVFIFSSLNLDFSINRITRYLTQAWQSGGQPVVVLTKADLVSDYSTQLNAVSQAALGVPVHAVSAHTGYGLDELNQYLQPEKTIVFLGMSGVGKSSLLNALMEQEVMEVSSIREDDSRGRHTTTHRQLFMLPSGAMIIDTPGMRELGLFDADEGISIGFADVEQLITQCRFTDCQHDTEPGCAIRKALADGVLTQEKWEDYVRQKNESMFMKDKAGYLKEKNTRHKSLSKQIRKMKESGRIRSK